MHKDNCHNLDYSLLKKCSVIVLLCVFANSPLQAIEPDKGKRKSKIQKISDIRVVVDISGSMKKTDPNNLRRPAVRLLAGLIPEGSRAGIWNFGKQVNMAVKVGTVDDAWRALAREQSKKINSVGLYTNLESVMRKVSFDWKKPDPRYKRNLIILTDGHVDVSEDNKLDKASRTRIIKELVPALEKAKVKIHTIALSDDVDEKLLNTLSAYTDGLYKKVASANDLQKLFLQMLEQSVKLDTLPIKDSEFSVDASIKDMTLLIFNNDKTRPTGIITPEGKVWNKLSHAKKVKWYSDEGYDLVTIKSPAKGQWKIKAPDDKNNRVVVATNLKLMLEELPGSIMVGDALDINAYLEEDGKALTNKKLLSKFDFSLNRDAVSSSKSKFPLRKKENDGFTYTLQYSPDFKPGNHEIIIQAKSPTVEREIHHQFTVYSKKEVYGENDSPDNKIVRVVADSNKVLDKHEEKTVPEFKKEDKPLDEHAEKNEPEKTEPRVTENKKADVLELNKKNEANKEQDDKTAENNDGDKEASDKGLNWTFIIIAIVVGNAVLIGSLVGGYLLIKRRKNKLTEDAEDAVEIEDITEDKA